MAELNSLEELGASVNAAEAAPEAPVHVRKVDDLGRSYATGKRKNAIARVWVKPGTGKITVNGRDFVKYFARPVLQMVVQQPVVAAARQGPVRRRLHRHRRRPLRPGRCCPSRHLQGADLLRTRPARRSQEGWLPDPRQPRRRA
jgi:hypothetical protein